MKRKLIVVVLSLLMVWGILPSTIYAADANSDGYDDNDFSKLQAFLNQPSAVAGSTNGRQLNAAYNPNLPATWTGVEWNTANPKRVIYLGGHFNDILWYQKSLAGPLDLSGFTALISLCCQDNKITSINVSGDTSLINMDFPSNLVSSLNTSGATALQHLYAGRNRLTALDVSIHPALRNLDCYENSLTALDISSNTALEYLLASNNLFTSLDVSHNTALRELSVSYNKLTALDVSANTELTYLGCNYNQLTELDASRNTKLTFFFCQGNKTTRILARLNGGNIALQAGDYGYVELTYNYYSNSLEAKAVTRSGSAFENWTASGMPVSTSATYALTPGISYDITANFVFTIYFNSNGGTAAVPSSIKAPYGAAISPPAPPTRTGYTFAGWYRNTDFASAWNFDTDTVTGTQFLYAKWDINSYTVTFYDWDGTRLDQQSVEYRRAATAPPDPDRTGYTFNGWNKLFGYITGDLDITAKYYINSYVVTFFNWNGTIWDQQMIDYGSAATAPPDPSRTGYTFTGWDKAYDFITDTLNVTAQYSINSYTVTFYDWDGTRLDQQSVEYRHAATAPPDPGRTGYTFTGWNKAYNLITGDLDITARYNINSYTVAFYDWDGTKIDQQTIVYGNAATAPLDPGRTGHTFTGWDKSFDFISDDTDVTARYSINSYTVTFYNWDGTLHDQQSVHYGSAATAPPDPSKTGHTFTGWDKAYSFVSDDIDITAQYSINSYTVAFYDWDGTKIDQQTIEYGSAATAPPDPGRTGHTFTEWDKAYSFVSDDLDVTARYSVNSYTVTFYNWDGTRHDQQSIHYGSAATAPLDPARTGHTFTGWDKAYDLITDDMDITAQFSINSYTVTFYDWDGTQIDQQTIVYGSAAAAPLDPSRTGHTFTGWDKAYSLIIDDIDVTAQYSINSYAVHFDEQGGSETSDLAVSYNTAMAAPPEPTRTGYAFGGWHKDLACTAAWNFDTDTVTGDTTLYAKWTGIPITDLPAAFTMHDGGRVTWDPQPSGGSWAWDAAFFSATFNSPATFTALKAGTSAITYTVNGVSQNIAVTIREAVLPVTGQSTAMVWVLVLLSALCCTAALFLKHRQTKQDAQNPA